VVGEVSLVACTCFFGGDAGVVGSAQLDDLGGSGWSLNRSNPAPPKWCCQGGNSGRWGNEANTGISGVVVYRMHRG